MSKDKELVKKITEDVVANFGCYLVDYYENRLLDENMIQRICCDFMKSEHNKPDQDLTAQLRAEAWVSRCPCGGELEGILADGKTYTYECKKCGTQMDIKRQTVLDADKERRLSLKPITPPKEE